MLGSCGDHSLGISLILDMSCTIHHKILYNIAINITLAVVYTFLYHDTDCYFGRNFYIVIVEKETVQIKLLISSSFVILFSLGFSFW